MTLENSHGRTIQDHAQDMFNVFLSLGDGWHGQADLAKAMKKARLSAADLLLLSYLMEKNLIEGVKEPARGPIGYRWAYRVKEGKR